MLFFGGVFFTFIYRLRLLIRVLNSGGKGVFGNHVSVIMMLFSFVLVRFSVFGLW